MEEKEYEIEEMKEELEKTKDQVRSLRVSSLVLSITVVILTICFWSRYLQIQQSLSDIVQSLWNENLIHRLILSMYQVL